MKNKFLAICVSVTASLLICACDYIRNANPPANPVSGGSTTSPGVVYRKVVVEDFTGHQCGNCPAAARELKKLDSIYSGKLIPIAVHAGFYARLTPSSNPPYPTDLRSQAGTDYDNTFGNSAFGNPNGLVNRIEFGTANFIKQWSAWGAPVSLMDTMPADFKIDVAISYNTGSNQVTSTVTTTALKAKTGTYNLVVVLTEDSITAEQIDYSLPAGQQYLTNYVFNHVLRGSVNSSWGDQIFTGTVNINDSKVKTYSNFQLSANWKYKKCKVIAYIYDADVNSPTHYEILQAEGKSVY